MLAAAGSSGTVDEAYGARSIKVELQLANVLDLNPQDPVFQEFASRCKVRYPMVVKEFVSGSSAFHDPLPGGIQGILGSHRMIPAGGARFVAVPEPEARDIVIRYWRVPGARTTFFERLKNLQEQRRTSICCERDFAVRRSD
ncbi:MAG TPA: hypothetical protein VN901_02800 [Candidatus Acidoferrales bacterium]|nr:hypothetical protein [Candidatus Acidoferrales bacterium]